MWSVELMNGSILIELVMRSMWQWKILIIVLGLLSSSCWTCLWRVNKRQCIIFVKVEKWGPLDRKKNNNFYLVISWETHSHCGNKVCCVFVVAKQRPKRHLHAFCGWFPRCSINKHVRIQVYREAFEVMSHPHGDKSWSCSSSGPPSSCFWLAAFGTNRGSVPLRWQGFCHTILNHKVLNSCTTMSK